MDEPNYRVSHSVEVSAQFLALSSEAKLCGRLAEFLRCSKWIWSELTNTPLVFGEGRYYDLTPRLLYRVAQTGPLFVEFAVMESEKIVFIRRFALRYPK